MATVDDFPPELTLQIFPHLTLKALIAADGVCQQWREFIVIADINPPRRALFKLYKKIVHDPLFRDLDTRPWLWENLRAFDRQAYLDHILAQHNYIPEDFRLWILEWPNKAVIACAWPGLPAAYCAEHADDVERAVGYNHLTPQLRKIIVELQSIYPAEHWSDVYDPRVEEEVDDPREAGVEEDWYQESGTESLCPVQDESELGWESDWGEECPEDYYQTHEVFRYSPPAGPFPLEVVFPALLVWEIWRCGQTFLALSPDSPFSVYYIDDDCGWYDGRNCHAYVSWISWLEARLRRMHRAADWGSPLFGLPLDSDGNVVDAAWNDGRVKDQPPRLWTEEDEARYQLGQTAIL